MHAHYVERTLIAAHDFCTPDGFSIYRDRFPCRFYKRSCPFMEAIRTALMKCPISKSLSQVSKSKYLLERSHQFYWVLPSLEFEEIRKELGEYAETN